MSDHDTEQQEDSARASVVATASAYVVTLFGGTPGALNLIDSTGTIIGRDNASHLSFDDTRMSRAHARIQRTGLCWELTDLGSRNGGYVDGAPFASNATVALEDGAIVRLGDTLFAFRARLQQDSHDAEREVFPGSSPLAAEVRRRLALLANSPGHVLILGETGTGKERIARRIGRSTPPRPFVPQNCAEISRDLGRSELFGHVRGAFSGATTPKPGLVDAVQDGVLFLDEIGDLPLDVQGELLRFLEDGSYRAVGATELRISTARVVAATNVDLDEAVRNGTFRRDLLARLRASNAPLELPPLRKRREDILGWARLFLDEANPTDLPPEIWNAGAAECLVLGPWPENLRELRGVMRLLVETPPGWPIASTSLPQRLQDHRRQLRDQASAPDPSSPTSAEPTRDAIEAALVSTEGRMRPASVLLGVDRRKLYRLCEKHGINIDQFRSGGTDE